MDQKVTLNLKVTKEQRHDLDMAATEMDKPMSQIIRDAIAMKLRDTSPARAKSWEPELEGVQHSVDVA